jgi:antitoxin (DNA-binding transcriptional repressor) of toxin-antitoxin stability system
MKKYLLALLLLILLFHSVSAQKGTHITKRVTFPRGSNSTIIKGRARWGASHVYLLRARAGQVLTMHLEGVPVARIVPPRARNYEALEGADNVKDWAGKLPKTGVYQINVGHADDAYTDVPYILEIKVE